VVYSFIRITHSQEEVLLPQPILREVAILAERINKSPLYSYRINSREGDQVVSVSCNQW
jgi:hypothetical protein